MCDYSLTNVKSRPAVKDESLITRNFGTGTIGFSDLADPRTAVCLLPGTELAFDKNIVLAGISALTRRDVGSKVARFRQVNPEMKHQHHDALELPDGTTLMLTSLHEGQTCKVLQLPAAPKTKQEAAAQRRVEYAG